MIASLPSLAQYTKLVDFEETTMGRGPNGSLISDGTYLYGMTNLGGTDGLGTVFKVKPDGTGFEKLLDFTGVANGAKPVGSLYFDGSTLYGMTQNGGTTDDGTVFKILPDGTGFAKMHDFTGQPNGWEPKYGALRTSVSSSASSPMVRTTLRSTTFPMQRVAAIPMVRFGQTGPISMG